MITERQQPGGRPPSTAGGPPPDESLRETLTRGRPLPAGSGEALMMMMGAAVGRQGLSRVLACSFPGVRNYVIQIQQAADRSVDFTIVGVNRQGRPVFEAQRALARGRDGSLEIHRVSETVDPSVEDRNLPGDNMERELALLRALDSGPGARITRDAHEASSYGCALNGFMWADETQEGPPVRSRRPLATQSDRAAIAKVVERTVARVAPQLDAATVLRLTDAILAATTPNEIVQVDLPGHPLDIPARDRGLAGNIGRAVLLDPATPAWRAALYARQPESASAAGAAFRVRCTELAAARLNREIEDAIAQLDDKQRTVQISALRNLSCIASSSVIGKVRAMADSTHRGVAAVARQTVRLITGADWRGHIAGFAADADQPPGLRGLAYRILAEYYPALIAEQVPMLRVHPDARIQRSVVPIVLDNPSDAGPSLASLLAANPWNDRAEHRPGLAELRLEIIEGLSRTGDSRSVPALMLAMSQSPPANERMALSRALVAHPDPRARRTLSAVAERLDRPLVP